MPYVTHSLTMHNAYEHESFRRVILNDLKYSQWIFFIIILFIILEIIEYCIFIF